MTASNQTFRGKVDLSTTGTSYNQTSVTTTDPGVTKTLINQTVAAGKKAVLLQAFITCNLEGKIDITVDGTNIGSARTGPAEPNTYFSWLPYEEVAAGGVIKVDYTAASFRPITDIEAYLQARIVDV